MNKEQVKIWNAFLKTAENSYFGAPWPQEEEEDKYPHERLGDGYELRVITDMDGKPIDNTSKYSLLYHNGLPLSTEIFRKGGGTVNYKDGYCSLIHYTRDKKRDNGFSFGTHVIVNHLGEIVLRGEGSTPYPYHAGGHIGKLKDTYYDLRSGSKIITCSSSGSISSKNLIILEHRYDWNNKTLPLGVYSLNKWTCELIKIDEIK